MLKSESEFDIRCSTFRVGRFLRSEISKYKVDMLIPKRDINITRGLDHFAVRRHQTQPVDRIRNRNVPNLIVLIAHHRSEMSFVGKLDRFNTEARAEDSIEGCGRAPALQVPQHRAARFFSGARSDFGGHDVADPA